MASQAGRGAPTWIVLARDVSASVRVSGQPTVAAAIVLDAERGLILTSCVADRPAAALREALHQASGRAQVDRKRPAPVRILCPPGWAREVGEQASALGLEAEIAAVEPSDEVEDIFDSLVGHLAGRRQPSDMPSPEEWAVLFRQAQAFVDAQPWRRLSDEVHLRMGVQVGGTSSQGVGIVLGNAGITYGFALYPGDTVPAAVLRGDAGTPPPPGTLVLTLDPPAALPPELADKARRYHWPEALPLWPAFFAWTDEGAAELSRGQVTLLSVALAGVLNHEQQQGPPESAGEIMLPGGRPGRYRVCVAATAGEQDESDRGVASIDRALETFLQERRTQLAPRTVRTYESVIELLQACLNSYGYQSLSELERRRWQAAYDAGDEQAFCRLFGPDKIVDNLGEFLGYFMMRKVLAGEALLRASGTVTRKLVVWLAERGYATPAAAQDAIQRAGAAAHDLPQAARLASVLSAAAQAAAPANVQALADEDYIEDYLTISRVEPGRLWFGEDIGPVKVPKTASELARQGWMVNLVLGRVRGQWRILEVGNVYPE